MSGFAISPTGTEGFFDGDLVKTGESTGELGPERGWKVEEVGVIELWTEDDLLDCRDRVELFLAKWVGG